MTGDIDLDYTPGTWSFSLTSSLQGRMYIDYNSEDDGATSKIKKTNTFMLFNCRAAKRFGMCTVYAGAKNIFSYIQDESIQMTQPSCMLQYTAQHGMWVLALNFNTL